MELAYQVAAVPGERDTLPDHRSWDISPMKRVMLRRTDQSSAEY